MGVMSDGVLVNGSSQMKCIKRAATVLVVLHAIVFTFLIANPAFAQNTLEAASINDLHAQSYSKMWVLVASDDDTYAYNAKGQVVKIASRRSATKETFKYRDDRISSFKRTSDPPSVSDASGRMSYGKDGRLRKTIVSSESLPQGDAVFAYASNPKGQITKESLTIPSQGSSSATVSYDKNGRVCKKKAGGYTWIYAYDSRGNLKKAVASAATGRTVIAYSNKYKNGCLVSSSSTSTNSALESVRTYKYKLISIDSRYVSQVKAQQWALLHPDQSFVFPRA